MKKTIALLTLGAALSAAAQVIPANPGYVWTNEVATFTNVVLNSATPIPLSKEGHAAAIATLIKWNQQYGLDQATNRYSLRDVLTCYAWHWAERNAVPEWKAEQEAKADIVSIRTKLPDATDTQLNQIKVILGL